VLLQAQKSVSSDEYPTQRIRTRRRHPDQRTNQQFQEQSN